MQLLVAPVSIKALQSVDPTLVGKVVPCSEPINISSALSICSFSMISFFAGWFLRDRNECCLSTSHCSSGSVK